MGERRAGAGADRQAVPADRLHGVCGVSAVRVALHLPRRPWPVPGVGEMLRPEEDAIVGGFIPALLDIQLGELTPTLYRLLGYGPSKAT